MCYYWSAPNSLDSMVSVNIEWDLDDSWFILVSPTFLLALPTFNHSFNSATDFTTILERSLTKTPYSGFSLNSNLERWFGLNKSLISSLYNSK